MIPYTFSCTDSLVKTGGYMLEFLMSAWFVTPSVKVLPRYPSIKIRPLWLHSFSHCCLVCSLASVKSVEWQWELTGGLGLICSRYCLLIPWLHTYLDVLYLPTLNHSLHTHSMNPSPHWCINSSLWSPNMSKVWRFHHPADPEPEALITSRWTWLNLQLLQACQWPFFLSFLFAHFLIASLCERRLFLPSHLSSSATVTQPSLGPVLFVLCWMANTEQCLQILLS